MRTAQITRKTTETHIDLELNLDGSGRYEIASGNGFFDHMLELFTAHSNFDLKLSCQGDTKVDFHHSAEDIGIVLGQALAKAVGDKKGIFRYGSFILPMDEALILTALDLSGRSYCNFDVLLSQKRIGTFDTELVKEFLLAFSRSANLTLHVKQTAGENTHHIIEAVFKSLGRALAQAVAIDHQNKGKTPSTKGIL
ncbi:MAG: imidazoleglycerol-phosphate dehydratase HisB [Bacillota bacterium]|jgi:imidazoleglycerol-phosphate dehydratase